MYLVPVHEPFLKIHYSSKSTFIFLLDDFREKGSFFVILSLYAERIPFLLYRSIYSFIGCVSTIELGSQDPTSTSVTRSLFAFVLLSSQLIYFFHLLRELRACLGGATHDQSTVDESESDVGAT